MACCTNCDANWSDGHFTARCPQCGGGAMERPCGVCQGRCGQLWKRAVLDSQDSNEAHWMGTCGLPPEEQRALMKEQFDRDEP